MYKLYVNYNYRLIVKTLLFLTMDLLVFRFKTKNDEIFLNKLTEKMFNNTQDLDLLTYYYSPLKLMDLVTNINTQLNINELSLGRKHYNKINIDSYDNLLNMSFDTDIKDVSFVWVKRFDKDNYIIPVVVNVNDNYLKANNHTLNISELFQEIDNKTDINKILIDFRRSIFI